MSRQLEAGQTNTALPFLIKDWLPAVPGRQILITGANDSAAAGKIDLLVEKILGQDASALFNYPNGAEFPYEPASAAFKPGDPFTLPFDSDRFDLVICNFLSAGVEIKKETLAVIDRVMCPNGRLLIIDNLVPGSWLRGKKARQQRLAGEWVNSWMRLWNPQHKRYLSQDAWTRLLTDDPWTIQQMATCETPQDFDTWADRFAPTPDNRIRLQAMLVQAPEKVHRFLTPLVSGDRIAFRMTEVFILATVAKDAQ